MFYLYLDNIICYRHILQIYLQGLYSYHDIDNQTDNNNFEVQFLKFKKKKKNNKGFLKLHLQRVLFNSKLKKKVCKTNYAEGRHIYIENNC